MCLEQSRLKRDPAALLAFDLDRFKALNDEYGHHIGDEALKLFCSVAKESMRPHELLGRLGGEEFAAILPGSDAAAARRLAQEIVSDFAARGRCIESLPVRATVSVGVSMAQGETRSLAELLIAADRALYSAKELGRNRVEQALEGCPTTAPSVTAEPLAAAAA